MSEPMTEGEPAPEWQSWPMITAGDGRHYTGPGYWYRVDQPNRLPLSQNEIAALGPVRRCVPVTLPDDSDYPGPSEFISMREDAREYADVYGTEAAEEYAAELLAAALHGECQKLDPEVGREDEGYSCTTHNMPWGECPPPSIPESWDLITAGDGRLYRRVQPNRYYNWHRDRSERMMSAEEFRRTRDNDLVAAWNAGMPVDEMAEALEVQADSVRTIVHRAARRLGVELNRPRTSRASGLFDRVRELEAEVARLDAELEALRSQVNDLEVPDHG